MSYHSQQQWRAGRTFGLALIGALAFYALAFIGGCVVLSQVVGG